jgi:hypothetical protein
VTNPPTDIGLIGIAVSLPGEATGIALGRDKRYFKA